MFDDITHYCVSVFGGLCSSQLDNACSCTCDSFAHQQLVFVTVAGMMCVTAMQVEGDAIRILETSHVSQTCSCLPHISGGQTDIGWQSMPDRSQDSRKCRLFSQGLHDFLTALVCLTAVAQHANNYWLISTDMHLICQVTRSVGFSKVGRLQFAYVC